MTMKELYAADDNTIRRAIVDAIMEDRLQGGPFGSPHDVWNMLVASDGEASIKDMIEELASRS